MIYAILSLFLKFLPGPIFDYLKDKNVVEKTRIEAETRRRKYQAEVLIKESEHWIAWLPRFIIAMSVALYTAQVLVSSMLHQPAYGPLKLPTDFIAVLLTVIGALFLDRITKRFAR
jgi:hypothetical protein